MQTLEKRDGLRTSHSRSSHSSGWVKAAEAVTAARQEHLYYSRRRGGVKESIETLVAKAGQSKAGNAYAGNA
jgi:hypothetical protein